MTPRTNNLTSNPNRPKPEETLVSDPRAGLAPAQQVERKLLGLLPAVPASVLTERGLLTPRRMGA
jgi:hypothetical protein